MSEVAAVETTVQGEIRRLVVLAWPVVLGQIGIMAMGFIDVMMVGRLGGDALAALALGNGASFALIILGLGAAMGLDPIIAQAWGGGRREVAARALVDGLAVLTLLGVALTVGHALIGPALILLRQPPELVGLAASYAGICGLSVVPLLLFSGIRQYLQAAGRMTPPMWAVAVANLVNVGANAVLIYGIGPFEGLGALGSAWATVFARVAMLLALVPLVTAPVRAGLADRVEPWGPAMRRLASVAMPVGFQAALEVWAFDSALVIMGWLGSLALAAHAVSLTLASMAFMVPLGLSAAAATRVGNLFGAGRAWTRAAWIAIATGCAATMVNALLFASFPEPLGRLFTDDPEVIGLVKQLLPIAAAFQLFDGIQVMTFGVLRGVGDTRVPALANVFGYWTFGLPIAAGLALTGWGPTGVWYGLTLGLAAVATLVLLRLRGIISGRFQPSAEPEPALPEAS